MQLNRIEDNRDSFAKLRRSECIVLARANGLKPPEFDENMPGQLMQKILRAKGISIRNVPHRPIGSTNTDRANPKAVLADAQRPPPQEPTVVEQNYEDALEQQWKAATVDYTTMHMHEIRKIAKDAGITVDRKSTKAQIIEMLNG